MGDALVGCSARKVWNAEPAHVRRGAWVNNGKTHVEKIWQQSQINNTQRNYAIAKWKKKQLASKLAAPSQQPQGEVPDLIAKLR